MSINLHLPENIILKPCITVFGVGGAGCNAVNNMIMSGLEGARFVVANTDAQCLEHSKAIHRIQLGETITRGLGAGASPEVGRAGAEEAIENINEQLKGSNLVFITAGMGGGTGTGAAPVIAKAAREQGILTVAVVTKPFHFEGIHRMKIAESGLVELQDFVDTLIVIPNQNLFRIANEKTTFADAFKMADDVLKDGVRSITDLMIMPGLINLDFADVRSVMSEMGKAMMGSGEAEGENRAIVAAEAAISNPLLDNSSMKGARGVLINITGGADMTLFEVDAAANRIRDEVDPEANIIFGSAFNENLEGKIRVSVVATGIDDQNEFGHKYRLSQNQKNLMTFRSPASKNNSPIAGNEKIKVNDNVGLEENQQFTTTSQDTHDTENDDFIMPPAIDPEQIEKTTSNFSFEMTNHIEEEKPKEQKKPLGLFGRMVTSVGLKTGTSTKTQHDKQPQLNYRVTEQSSDNRNKTVEEELVTDSMLDIPAFQRRNK